MKLFNINDKLFFDVKIVSVVLRKINNEQYHSGLLYKSDEGNKILHLAWHRDLQSIEPTKPYIWIELPISESRSRQVAGMCRLIWKENKNNKIPYAFNSPINVFDPITGTFKINNDNVGLTCSSFVLAVLNVSGLDLVIYNSWPKNQSEAILWQNQMTQYLEQNGAESEHIERVREQLGNERFVPTQVFASVSSPPMDYDTAKELSSVVIDYIEKWVEKLK